MKKSIKVDVAKPCGEKFESFDITPAGGFCNSCQKEVIDFSIMSDAEIIDYFKQSRPKTCGRFNTTQLKQYPLTIPNNTQNSFTKRAGLWGISLLALLPFTHTSAQDIPSKNSIHMQDSSFVAKAEKAGEQSSDSCKVSGIVRHGEDPLPFVNVYLKERKVGTSTDIDGKFTFPVPLKKGDVLTFSFVGFANLDYVLDEIPSNPIQINMMESEALMGEIVIMGDVAVEEVYSSKKSIWRRLTAFLR